MPESRGQLAQGSLVWADVADGRGHIKRRPLVIVTETSEIVLDGPVVGVAVTTTYPEPPPREFVELPWDRRRHPATRLVRRSAAVCNWLVELTPSQVVEVRGYVPTKVLLQIIERVRDLNG